MAEARLWLLVGLPGSGKSTWATRFVNRNPGYGLVSTDAIRRSLFGDEAIQGDWSLIWREVQGQWRTGLEAMVQGNQRGLLYDATNARRRFRRDAIATAKTLGFSYVTGLWFDVPLEVCLARNRQRQRQVPEAIIQRMARQLQGAPPALAEGLDCVIRLST